MASNADIILQIYLVLQWLQTFKIPFIGRLTVDLLAVLHNILAKYNPCK